MVEHVMEIHAPAERVWALTLAIESWPDFTPTMSSVERLDDGPIRIGSQARVTQPRQRPRTWTVTRIEPNELFEWEARFGRATMTASHRVAATGDGCINTLTVAISGPGRRLLTFLLGPLLRRALATENCGFKAAAEDRVHPDAASPNATAH